MKTDRAANPIAKPYTSPRLMPLPAVGKRLFLGLPPFLLPLLLLAGINPLLSTALADGGAAAIVPVLQTTFTNPTPAAGDRFGWSVAAVGNDRILIGAQGDDDDAATLPSVGRAYLFSLSGTLLTTFNNPTPAADDFFGWSVAAVGNDRVLISSPNDSMGSGQAGAAYLFSTNGTRLTTFANPTPANPDRFGQSVAAMGNDRVIIAARGAGEAYLFSISGTLLTTFTNPAPAAPTLLGTSVAAVGNERVLIGAGGNEPAVYLFSTNGMLLTTFTNPIPAYNDEFGLTVAAVGNDRVIIGARLSDTGAMDAGVAHLFSTNGTLLTTFTNPTPASTDNFGQSVAAVGSDRVIIGAPRDGTGGTNAGAAYLFSTNGTLLATITKPTPAADDYFGWSVAAVGNDRVLIGAHRDDAGATDAGAAYLFALVPSLDIQPTSTNTLAVSWPLLAPDFLLQQNTNGLATGNWSNVTDPIQNDGTNNYIIVDPAVGNRFYRLSKVSQ